jgi:hypothetical protein
LLQQPFRLNHPGSDTSRPKQLVLGLIVREPSVGIAFCRNGARTFLAEQVGHLGVYKESSGRTVQSGCGEVAQADKSYYCEGNPRYQFQAFAKYAPIFMDLYPRLDFLDEGGEFGVDGAWVLIQPVYKVWRWLAH